MTMVAILVAVSILDASRQPLRVPQNCRQVQERAGTAILLTVIALGTDMKSSRGSHEQALFENCKVRVLMLLGHCPFLPRRLKKR